jgi:hypothetical protein
MDKTADKWITGIDKHELKGDHFMANDQQQGVFGSAIGLDWIIIVDNEKRTRHRRHNFRSGYRFGCLWDRHLP